MRACLLAPGPSLANYDGTGLDFYAVVCGVNRAACRFKCDMWAAKDLPRIIESGLDVIGRPKLLSCWETIDSLARCGNIWADDSVELDLVFPVHQWSLFTAPAALVYLASIGAKSIDCYGVDMVGKEDWDGVKAGENREPSRWDREQEIWNHVTDFLSGVVVNRVNA